MADPFVVQRPWLAPLPGAPMNACRLLLCFPYGGVPSAFMFEPASEVVATWAVKLPGREDRSMEGPVSGSRMLSEAILDALQSVGMPYAFYGHSFGAGLALDVTHALVDATRAADDLVLSDAPHTGYSRYWVRWTQPIVAESMLREPLATANGCLVQFRQACAGQAQSRPSASMHNSLIALSGPLPVPLYVLNGQDDPLLELHCLDEWQRYTSKSFHSEYVPGGHFFFNINFQLLYLPLLTALDEQGSERYGTCILEHPYLSSLDACALSIDGLDVVITPTIFFAEYRQESDKGCINRIEVTRPRLLTSASSIGLAEDPDFAVGDLVSVEIDWPRRYALMRLHFAALKLCWSKFPDLEKIGAHIGQHKARIDFSLEGNVSQYFPEILQGVEHLVAAYRLKAALRKPSACAVAGTSRGFQMCTVSVHICIPRARSGVFGSSAITSARTKSVSKST
uniref:Thioesterase n=1 Tax=Pseudomonas syringae TaxID=317 RepID=Q52380_PSESX|nr:thioesterase [Pseudomonas syringae]